MVHYDLVLVLSSYSLNIGNVDEVGLSDPASAPYAPAPSEKGVVSMLDIYHSTKASIKGCGSMNHLLKASPWNEIHDQRVNAQPDRPAIESQ